MNKLLSIVAMVFCSTSVSAASVLWNAFTVADDGCGGKTVELHSSGFDVSFYVSSYNMGGLCLTAWPNDARQKTLSPISTYISGAWISAVRGDLSLRETMIGQEEYFFNELHGMSSSFRETDIPIVSGASQYLKLVLQDFDEAYAYLTGQATEIPSLYYGWMEYSCDDGVFSILNSAIGLDGQAMTVGAIPEPSCALLLLVGCAGLMLRRKEHCLADASSGIRKTDSKVCCEAES